MNAVEAKPSRTGAAIGVILNPRAGGGRALRLLPRVVAALRELDELHHVHVTAAPGEAIEVARRFAGDGMRLVVAVGGDGTLNEVANGLLAAEGGQVPLGVVPAGRGADFVRTLDGPKDPAAALARICRVEPRPVDVGRATFADGTSRAFVNVGGLGFDAAVAVRAAHSRLPGSTIPYLRGLAGALVRYRNLPMTVDADGARFAGLIRSVVVANGKFFGGGMKIVPDAALDDGLLDLAILGDLTRLDLVRNVPRVYRGTHVTHPKFTHLTARSIRVEGAAPAQVQLDGELVGTAPVTFTVEPGALLVAG